MNGSLRGQHIDDYLSLILSDGWMAENSLQEIISYERYANQKGRLRGKRVKSFNYKDSIGITSYSGVPYLVEYQYTDSSSVRSQIFQDKYLGTIDFTTIYEGDRIKRTEDQWSHCYYEYNSIGQLMKIWCENNGSLDYGRDEVTLFEYDDRGRLESMTELNLKTRDISGYMGTDKELEVRLQYVNTFYYAENRSLERVEVFMAEEDSRLEKISECRYMYDDSGLAIKVVQYTYEGGAGVLLREVEYVYK
jgi:hypothetical protein